MRITRKYALGQLSLLLCFLTVFLSSCTAKGEEIPVVPPVTSPLTGGYIGFGVITASFTHITLDPRDDSDSLGYLRRGSLVKVIRRQIIRVSGNFIAWVLIDAEQRSSSGEIEFLQGWLKEDVMSIYSNESQAKTASETILR